jgi:RNA polymerase sigma-70 factor, ECF subfamily
LRRCRTLLKDEAAAADAAQDTFVRLLEYQGALVHKGPSSLLYTMATNVCLNRLRARGRKLKILGDCAGGAPVEETPVHDSFTDRIIASDLTARIMQAVPATTGRIVDLHYRQERTLEETAEAVGMSVSGVRKRLASLKDMSRNGRFERIRRASA